MQASVYGLGSKDLFVKVNFLKFQLHFPYRNDVVNGG